MKGSNEFFHLDQYESRHGKVDVTGFQLVAFQLRPTLSWLSIIS